MLPWTSASVGADIAVGRITWSTLLSPRSHCCASPSKDKRYCRSVLCIFMSPLQTNGPGKWNKTHLDQCHLLLTAKKARVRRSRTADLAIGFLVFSSSPMPKAQGPKPFSRAKSLRYSVLGTLQERPSHKKHLLLRPRGENNNIFSRSEMDSL